MDADKALFVRKGPMGTRIVSMVASGGVKGSGLAGALMPGSGDWVTIRQDGMWDLDVRAAIVTDDGATILYCYTGVGTPIAEGRIRVRGAPRFETDSPKYAWLNAVQAVALGEADPQSGTVFYDIFSLA